MMTPEPIKLANAESQRSYIEGLDALGLCRITAVIPKDYKQAMDIYAVRAGKKKKEVLAEVIKAGMEALSISGK